VVGAVDAIRDNFKNDKAIKKYQKSRNCNKQQMYTKQSCMLNCRQFYLLSSLTGDSGSGDESLQTASNIQYMQ